MRLFPVVVVVGFLALAVCNFAADEPRAESSTSLADAVTAFNILAQNRPNGRDQAPLTEDEVVAAIRGWVRDTTPPATDATYDEFQKIAETRRLPKGAKFVPTDGWNGYRGFRFEVWWVDFEIPVGEKSHYNFRIRSRTISSRPLTERERQQSDADEQRRIERQKKTDEK
jgi:hypothetical protein